jgi:PAS domain S-box-containing protein
LYRSLIESLPHGLVLFQDNHLIFANPASAALTGYSLEALSAMTWQQFLDLVHPDDRNKVTERLQTIGEREASSSYIDVRFIGSDGTLLWVEVTPTAIVHEYRPATQLLLQGVTGHHSSDLDPPDELKELKNQFISMVSHLFRTPLSVISTTSYLLENYVDKISPEKRADYFGKIRSQIGRIDGLIEQILTIHQTQAKALHFTPSRFDLEHFCRELADDMQTTASASHRLIFQATPDLGDVVMDDHLLWNILANLLSNAIKFSPNGGEVIFHLELDGDEAIFQISDTGIGIPADDQKHLYEPFYRGQNVGNIKGAGLGLKIVKDYVDLHGGTIACTSEPGNGTTFTVRLPLG